MRFRVLGPIELDGGEIGSRKQAIVLAVLLAASGRPVSRERLIDALWNEDPPPSADNTLRWHVHRLRRALGPSDPGRVHRDGRGYRLRVDPGELDAEVFQSLALEGDRLFAAGSLPECSAVLVSALELWRGPAFAGLGDVPVLGENAVRLDELRSRVFEQWVDVELALGHHDSLIAPLQAAVAEHPLREGLCGRLMLALHRSGRQADALAAYASLRTTLADELGLDPGPEVRRIDQEVRSDSSSGPAHPPPPPIRPAELPPGNPAFTGRSALVETISGDLTAPDPESLRVVVLSGAGGAGKSTLAVHVAHRVSSTFPDGVLYVDLRGSTPGAPPLAPEEVLGRILRSVGIDVPADVDEAAGRFRTLTADRRLLVVLDNAASLAQIRPLLPGSPRSAVLITSRRVPTGLGGIVHHEIGGLSPSEAVVLLERLAGASRVAAEPEASQDVVRLCDLQPLAVSLAGARLLSRTSWSVRDLADRLADKGRRLEELSYGERPIRAGLSLSYDELGADAARLFTLLGSVELDAVRPPVAAALMAVSVREASDLLDELVDARLLDSPRRDHYAQHDLVRLYASSLAAALPDDERLAALERVLHFYVASARAATVLIAPGSEPRTLEGLSSASLVCSGLAFDSAHDAITWVDLEVSNLVGVARQAAEFASRLGTVLIALSTAIDMPFNTRGYWRELIRVHRYAVETATSLDHGRGTARAHGDLGYCYSVVGRGAEAQQHLEQALRSWRALGDIQGEARTYNSLGMELDKRGRFDEAIECYDASLELWRGGDQAHLTGPVLMNSSLAHQRLGRFDRAESIGREAFAISQRSGNRHLAGVALTNVGESLRRAGNAEAALTELGEAIELLRESGSRANEAEALWSIGLALDDLWRKDEALDRWRASLHVLEELGLISAMESRTALANPRGSTPSAILRL